MGNDREFDRSIAHIQLKCISIDESVGVTIEELAKVSVLPQMGLIELGNCIQVANMVLVAVRENRGNDG